MTLESRDGIGRVGVWTSLFSRTDAHLQDEHKDAAAELDELGYGAVWVGGSPGIEPIVPLLAATRRISVATGILNVWAHEPADVATQVAELGEDAARFVLGLGVSHPHATPGYSRPLEKMAAFLDGLDTAPVPVPPARRVLAALGPRMLGLAAERSAGAHPYLVTTEHVAQARNALGPGKLLAPELGVVLDADRARARETARGFMSRYLGMPNYRNSWLRLGFTEEDLTDGGSDRLLESVLVLGDAVDVRTRVAAFHEAGADHVSLQVIRSDPSLPRAEWRALAQAVPLT